MAVLERAREECARRGLCLERLAVIAEADDHRPRVESSHGLEQHLYALVLDQLAEVDDCRLGVSEEPREASRIARIGMPLARVGLIAARFLQERRQRVHPRLRLELVDVDA